MSRVIIEKFERKQKNSETNAKKYQINEFFCFVHFKHTRARITLRAYSCIQNEENKKTKSFDCLLSLFSRRMRTLNEKKAATETSSSVTAHLVKIFTLKNEVEKYTHAQAHRHRRTHPNQIKSHSVE